MTSATFSIGGMSCGHCVRAVAGALRAVPGLTVRRVEIGTAEVEYREGEVVPEQIREAVEAEGYTVRDLGREP